MEGVRLSVERMVMEEDRVWRGSGAGVEGTDCLVARSVPMRIAKDHNETRLV